MFQLVMSGEKKPFRYDYTLTRILDVFEGWNFFNKNLISILFNSPCLLPSLLLNISILHLACPFHQLGLKSGIAH